VDQLCSLSRLSGRLKLPRDWLRREALEGRLPCLKVGRKLLFNLAAVESVLASRAALEIKSRPQLDSESRARHSRISAEISAIKPVVVSGTEAIGLTTPCGD
jgi:hypothetical protein